MAHTSRLEAQRLQAVRTALASILTDDRIEVGMRVDMLKHVKAEADHAINQLRNPRPVITTDAEFMELIN